MEMERFELLTPCLQGRCSPNWATPPGLLFCSYLASLVLPMGLSGLEPPTSRLSGVRSNQLSYKPQLHWASAHLKHMMCGKLAWLNIICFRCISSEAAWDDKRSLAYRTCVSLGHFCVFGTLVFYINIQLSSFQIWQPPTLPHRLQCSTIGRLSLNHRVRDGNGCLP